MRNLAIIATVATVLAMGSTAMADTEQASNGSSQNIGQSEQPRKFNRSRKHTGGFVMRPASGKSIRFANAQTTVHESVLKGTAEHISQMLGLNFTVSGLDNANVDPATLRDDKTAAVVVIKASGNKDGTTMIVAPENGWSILDISPLVKDNPSTDKLAERVKKELWRTTAIMLGASDSNFKPCLLQPVHNLAQLDLLKAQQVCPEPYGAIQQNAAEFGCGRPSFVTYRTACKEGWAPAPTNDVQKAIWDEVHTIPSAPMKIKFDPKKGR